MKASIGALVLGLVFVGSGFAAKAADETKWKLEGKAVTADNCGVVCPCIFGMPPHHGECEFVGVLHVEKGMYGKLSLDNVNVALAGAFNRMEAGGADKYRFIAYYIDAGASAEQKEALKKIFAGPEFEPMGKPAEVKEVPISWSDMDDFGEVGETYGAKVGDVAEIHVTPISGADKEKPIVVENTADPMFPWTALGKTSDSFYKAAGNDMKFEGTSGESHKFVLSGGGKE